MRKRALARVALMLIFVFGMNLNSYDSAPAYASTANLSSTVAITNPVLAWNTFMGAGSQDDQTPGLAVDNWGNIYVAGDSQATWGEPIVPYSGVVNTMEGCLFKLFAYGTYFPIVIN